MAKTYREICDKVREIPFGKLATYGEVARACGTPKGAQMVGWALARLGIDETVPWQTVVAKGGRLSITNLHVTPKDQALWLEREGITCEERDGGLWVVNPSWHTFSQPVDLV